MWVAGDTLMLWPMIPVALGWMHLEERKAVRIDRQFDGSVMSCFTTRPRAAMVAASMSWVLVPTLPIWGKVKVII